MASNEIFRRVSSTANYARTAVIDEARGNNTDAGTRTIDTEGSSSRSESRYRLLVSVPGGEEIEEFEPIVRTAAKIAHDREGDLLLLCLVDVPRQTPYEAVTPDLPRVEQAHEAAERLLCVAKETGVRASTIVSHAETDVFVEKISTPERTTERILLAVSDGPHFELATETARAIALSSEGCIDIVHVLDESATNDERDEGSRILQAVDRLLDDVDHVNTHLVTGEDVAAEIVARSDAYDVTVLGAPTAGLLEQFVFGTVPSWVTRRTENTVLITKHRTGGSSVSPRWIAGDVGEEI